MKIESKNNKTSKDCAAKLFTIVKQNTRLIYNKKKTRNTDSKKTDRNIKCVYLLSINKFNE